MMLWVLLLLVVVCGPAEAQTTNTNTNNNNCSLPANDGQCDPTAFVMWDGVNPVVPQSPCYCTARSDTFHGTYCGSACVKTVCGSDSCACEAQYDHTNGGCVCASTKVTSTAYGCWRGLTSCKACPPGAMRIKCGCSDPGTCDEGFCYQCALGQTFSTNGVGKCLGCQTCTQQPGRYLATACTQTADAVCGLSLIHI